MLRRNRELREKVTLYAVTAKRGLQLFEEGMRHLCEQGLPGLQKWVRLVHEKESECDGLSSAVELDLFEKSLLPETREDLMNLLEWLDEVINAAEEALRMIAVQHVVVPNEFCEPLGHISRMSAEAGELAMDMAVNVLDEGSEVRALDEEVDRLESVVDRVEQKLVSDLFDGDLPLAEKLQLRDVITAVAAVSDRAEEVSNRLKVFLAKRRG